MLYNRMLLDVIVEPVHEFVYDYGTTLAIGCALFAVVVVTLVFLAVKKNRK